MNQSESERIIKMLRLGCCACAHLGIPNGQNIEAHHILSGNIRMGHEYTIPLCCGHHRGAWSPEMMEILTPEQRVAISDGRKAFTRVYPTERELYERVQFVLKLDTVWPVTKLVPRKTA